MATEDAQGLALKHCPVRDPDGEDLAKTLREGEGESEERSWERRGLAGGSDQPWLLQPGWMRNGRWVNWTLDLATWWNECVSGNAVETAA